MQTKLTLTALTPVDIEIDLDKIYEHLWNESAQLGLSDHDERVEEIDRHFNSHMDEVIKAVHGIDLDQYENVDQLSEDIIIEWNDLIETKYEDTDAESVVATIQVELIDGAVISVLQVDFNKVENWIKMKYPHIDVPEFYSDEEVDEYLKDNDSITLSDYENVADVRATIIDAYLAYLEDTYDIEF